MCAILTDPVRPMMSAIATFAMVEAMMVVIMPSITAMVAGHLWTSSVSVLGEEEAGRARCSVLSVAYIDENFHHHTRA